VDTTEARHPMPPFRLLAIWILAITLIGELCCAAEPTGLANPSATVDLLGPAVLEKWTPDVRDAPGWKLDDGRLKGDAQAAPLTWDGLPNDFELHVIWGVQREGAIKLHLVSDAGERGVDLRLAEDPGITIRLSDQARSLKIRESARGKPHATIIYRTGDKLRLEVDGVKSRELVIDGRQHFSLQLAIQSGEGTIRSLRAVELPRTGADK
jgi:hypothetical protein